MGTNLIEKSPPKESNKRVTYHYKFSLTFVDAIFLTLIAGGVVVQGVCHDASERGTCGGYEELNNLGTFLIIGGLIPYIVVIVILLFTNCFAKMFKN